MRATADKIAIVKLEIVGARPTKAPAFLALALYTPLHFVPLDSNYTPYHRNLILWACAILIIMIHTYIPVSIRCYFIRVIGHFNFIKFIKKTLYVDFGSAKYI